MAKGLSKIEGSARFRTLLCTALFLPARTLHGAGAERGVTGTELPCVCAGAWTRIRKEQVQSTPSTAGDRRRAGRCSKPLKKMESDWAERTIAVSGFPEDILPIAVMIDKLTIHFLRPRNGGGEVESVTYPTDVAGVAYVTFEKKEVVDSVLQQDQQVFEDKLLPKKFPLKISQNNVDVFSAVSVDLDFSIFEPSLELNKFLREHKSNNKILQFYMSPDGRLRVEGSFPALKALRKELHKKIGELQGFNFQDPALKSGISDSEGKPVKSLSNYAKQMTEPQKYTAPPSYEDKDTLDPGAFKDELTIMLDADTFSYIDEICKSQYEDILRRNNVTAKPINNNSIIFLQFETNGMWKPSQPMMAKHEMEVFISQMQENLVIERIRLDGDRRKNKTIKICKKITKLFPNVLFRFADDYVILIGNQDDCKQVMRKVEETVQTEFDPAFSECSVSLNPTEAMHQFVQSTGSDTAHTLNVPRPIENTMKSNSDGYMKSHFNSLPPSYSRNDSHENRGRSSFGMGTLVSGPPSLPPFSSVSMSATQERPSRMVPRSDRPPNRMHY